MAFCADPTTTRWGEGMQRPRRPPGEDLGGRPRGAARGPPPAGRTGAGAGGPPPCLRSSTTRVAGTATKRIEYMSSQYASSYHGWARNGFSVTRVTTVAATANGATTTKVA